MTFKRHFSKGSLGVLFALVFGLFAFGCAQVEDVAVGIDTESVVVTITQQSCNETVGLYGVNTKQNNREDPNRQHSVSCTLFNVKVSGNVLGGVETAVVTVDGIASAVAVSSSGVFELHLTSNTEPYSISIQAMSDGLFVGYEYDAPVLKKIVSFD